ncbi:MAG: hypothetical protein JST54_04500 [Deltaproteobacteria bacterium]|nr:hypothetical protein [Deltaproteobacteria bacterium]
MDTPTRQTLALLGALLLLGGCGQPGGTGDGGVDAGLVDGGSDAGLPTAAHDDPRLGAPVALLTQLQADLAGIQDEVSQEARIDQFMADVATSGGTPLRNGDDVTFLYRGTGAASVAGDWNGWSTTAQPMLSVRGTSLFIATQHFGDQERHAYKLVVNGAFLEDELDPWLSWDGIDPGSGLGTFNAMVTLPGHALLEGNTRREHFTSTVEANTRDVFVYLPPQYFQASDALPVIYNHDGREALTKGQFDQKLQGSIDGSTSAPIILVTVALDDQNNRGNEYVWDYDPTYSPQVAPNPRGDEYVKLLSDELVPFIDTHYRTLADASHRVVAGQSLGGLISGYIAFQRPEIWGHSASQSGSFFWNNNELITTVQNASTKSITWYLDSGTGDSTSDDNLAVTQQLWQTLQAHDYACTHVTEQGGTHDWPHWAGRFHNIPETFFPHG